MKANSFTWMCAGNGDRYVRGWNLHYAPITIRPNSSEEACWDTQHPSFDPCNVPLIMWSRWPYNLAEAYGTVYAKLWLTAKAGALPAELLPVLATPHGLRAPKHMATFLGGLFTRPLTTLAQLSARRVDSGCEDAGQAGAGLQQQQQQQTAAQGAEGSVGRVGRCFATAHLCKFRNRDVTSLVAAARDLQAHYAQQVAELLQSEAQATRSGGSGSGSTAASGHGSSHGASDTAWDGAGEGVLRVVFAVRPGMDARSLLNVEELLQQCNAWTPEVPAHLPTSTLPQGSGDDRSFGASDGAEGSENGARALRGAKPHVQRRLADPTVQEAANGHAGAMSGEPAGEHIARGPWSPAQDWPNAQASSMLLCTLWSFQLTCPAPHAFSLCSCCSQRPKPRPAAGRSLTCRDTEALALSQMRRPSVWVWPLGPAPGYGLHGPCRRAGVHPRRCLRQRLFHA